MMGACTSDHRKFSRRAIERENGLIVRVSFIGWTVGVVVAPPLSAVVNPSANGFESWAAAGAEDTWSVKTDDRSHHHGRPIAPPRWLTETQRKKN